MKQGFDRSNDSLAALFEFTEKVLATGTVSDAARFAVHLALEELFVNMVLYRAASAGPIDVELSVDGDSITAVLTEFGVSRFDISAPRTLDTDAPLGERNPGGLGIRLVQKLVDTLDYRYRDDDGESSVIFTKQSGI